MLLLDIKDRQTIKDVWRIVKNYKNSYGTLAYKWVTFKLDAPTYPDPGTLENDLRLRNCDEGGFHCWPLLDYNNFLFIPVFTSNMITKINCINTYNSYKDNPYTVTAEVNLKDYNGRNSDVYNAITSKDTAMLIFHAIPDATRIQPDAFFNNKGNGTYILKDLLQPPVPGQPNETIDCRSDLNFILGLNFRSITSDEPISVSDELRRRGWRNMSRMQDP